MRNNSENIFTILFYFCLAKSQEHSKSSQSLWKICRNHDMKGNTRTSSLLDLSSPSIAFHLTILNFILQVLSLHMVGRWPSLDTPGLVVFLEKTWSLSQSLHISSRLWLVYSAPILILCPGDVGQFMLLNLVSVYVPWN